MVKELNIALVVGQIIMLLPCWVIRTSCRDQPDPSGLKHKIMRYEGIITMDSEVVYWNK